MASVEQKVWVVLEQQEDGKDAIVGARLTLAAAHSLCKLAPNRRWKKTVATKEIGASKHDNR